MAFIVRDRASIAALTKLTARPRGEAKPARKKKKRPVKLPGPREASVVKSVLLYLADAGIKAWRNNAGRFTNPQGRSFRMGPPGSSDVLGCLLGSGRMLCVETKRPGGGRTTASQTKWLADMEAQGALCCVARSAKDVYAALKAAGYSVPEPRKELL